MSQDSPIRRCADMLLDLVVPRSCFGCGARGPELCSECVLTCLESPAPSGGIVKDGGVTGRLVRAGKSGRCRRVARVMGRIAAARILTGSAPLPPFDAVTWVPEDPRRGRVRGAHLPALFGRELARLLGVPAFATLERRTGSPQRGSSRRQRTVNVAGVFRPRTSGVRARVPARVLLVDDVRTTGATLAACREALAAVGVDAVPLAFCVVPLGSAASGRASASGRRPDLPIHDVDLHPSSTDIDATLKC